MIKESRVLQWYIDSFSTPCEFKNLNEEGKIELLADTLFYVSQTVLTLKNQISILENKLNHQK